jgi:hypothetical protein
MELWALLRPAMDADMYCNNAVCDLNIPIRQVVAGPLARRMEWKTKDGCTKHFCQTCAEAIATWQAERE